MKCRHCQSDLDTLLIDLGSAPPSNAYLSGDDLGRPERWYPLRVLVCTTCWLVQTEDFAERETLFDEDYAYFSSVSSTWLSHVDAYATAMIDRFSLNETSHVVEVACNDGALLGAFARRGIPTLGVEPTRSTADAARAKGLAVIDAFFGEALGRQMAADGQAADLIAANNVLAHVPDINDFVRGFRHLLKPGGVATFEFPHLLHLLEETQFDTIYHEHFSYLSLGAVSRIFRENGLAVVDVETWPTHGGSLRVFVKRAEDAAERLAQPVEDLLELERRAGLCDPVTYAAFAARALAIKDDALRFLLDARADGATCMAYGAAAKGNTFLNFAGIRPDLISAVVDRAPAKQGKYLPGSRIPIVAEDALKQAKPDFVLILPWNLRSEIATQLDYIREWGGRFVVFVPKLAIF
ncbi:MAG: class I SAM-dependent methyltransferase [Pseudomonadota bacterium]